MLNFNKIKLGQKLLTKLAINDGKSFIEANTPIIVTSKKTKDENKAIHKHWGCYYSIGVCPLRSSHKVKEAFLYVFRSSDYGIYFSPFTGKSGIFEHGHPNTTIFA